MSAIFAFYTAPGSWRDRLIRAATGYPESHVEFLVIPAIKHCNLCISASKRDDKLVRQKAITWNPGHWTFVEVPHADGADCFKRIKRHLNKPYDTLGAVLSITPLDVGIKGSWFCSELMADGLRLRNPARFTPGKLKQALLDMGGREFELSKGGE